MKQKIHQSTTGVDSQGNRERHAKHASNRNRRAAVTPLYRNVSFLERLEERCLLAAGPTFLFNDYDHEQILVRLKDEVSCSADDCSPIVDHVSTTLESSFPSIGNLHSIRVKGDSDFSAVLQSLSANPAVLYAEPNYRVRIAAAPNDPQFNSLWGLHNSGQTGGTPDADIDALEAWDQHTGSGQTVVAVIDTGVDYLHPDLAGNMWVNSGEIAGDGLDNDQNGFVDDVHGYDFFNNDGDPMDDHNHGTHVAGSIGAVGNNGVGITGVNWNVQIMALKFLDSSGNGDIAEAVAAIDYAVANGATISNNSWGFNGGFSQALYDSIAAARDQGHLFLAAAGNGNIFGIGQDNEANPFYPSSFDLDNIVAVAALDDDDNRAVFSNFGAQSVDVGAPGVDILSTTRNNTYSSFSGTSMATPHVAGLAALMRDLHPQWTSAQIIDRIMATVDPVSSLAGITTTGGRINALAALVPDTFGPSVIGTEPAALVGEAVSHVRIRFNEAIDAATFTAADVVQLSGPFGNIPVTSVEPVANSASRQFDVTFPLQTDVGEYQLVIGPHILDGFGNEMDQDDDGLNGEPLEDRFVHTFSLIPFYKRFDFGTASSPVESGHIGVDPTRSYDPLVGYGYQSPGVNAEDRGIGTAATRDLNYATEFTFAVDAPNAEYDVTLTIGDTGQFAHELMEVSLEGAVVDTVSTAAGEVKTITYPGIVVGDGQLTLDLRDLGGDPNVVINALEVAYRGPDTIGPHVTVVARNGSPTDPLDRIILTFNEAIDAATFTVADVVSLNGPLGSFAATAVQQVNTTQFEVEFDTQTELGDYQIVVGPQVLDVAGNAMDQDQDGIVGETVDDQFTGEVSILFVEDQRFDFGTTNSPLDPNYSAVTPVTTYSAQQGYGFQGATPSALDRGNGTDRDRDFVYSNNLTFAVDLPGALYRVTLRVGDTGSYAHDQMAVFLEGTQVSTLNTAAGQVIEIVYDDVPVVDGQLTLHMLDQGGDPSVVLNSLDIVYAGPDQSGPRVESAERAGNATDPLDRILLTFNESIDAATFTTADVVSLTGPQGPLTPTDVQPVSSVQFAVLFPSQTALGSYEVVVGPQITDTAGNPMDQDEDGILGEALDDQFTGEASIVLVDDQRFDFGTANSPLAAGYVRVSPSTTYSAALGYGFQGATPNALDRGNSTDLDRDLVYANSLTFAVDLPSAFYDVTLRVGDTGNYAHEQMAVFLEGTQVSTLSTGPGQVLEVLYEEVAVVGGQLTLAMQDLGGDPNVVLTGMDVTYVRADDVGPTITAVERTSGSSEPLDRIVVKFSEAIDTATFTVDDVTDLNGPLGPITPNSVLAIGSSEFEILFDPQTALGTYEVTVGPQILDVSGNAMDQDQDGVLGEAVDDQFTGEVSVVFVDDQRFDFGRSNSPVEPGYVAVTPATLYDPVVGFGFQGSAPNALDRGIGTALERDLVYRNSLTFAVDLPSALYDVKLHVGDTGNYAHEQMAIHLEGTQVATLNTAAGQVLEVLFEDIAVVDGQLTLFMQDLGGDPNVVLTGMEVTYAGADDVGPRVLSAGRVGDATDPLDRIVLTFSESIDAATFTASDIVSIDGPGGSIPANGVQPISDTEFEVLFDSQASLGDYQVTVGPDIRDAAGNAMDQDQDGILGEAVEDRFTGGASVVFLADQRFDFGTSNSPVEAGYVPVTPSTVYSSAVGYGFQGVAPGALDRGNSTDLDRDFVYRNSLTFAVDLPSAIYRVKLRVGDSGNYAHEQMAVFLEGTQVSTLSTAAGQVLEVVYEDVLIVDGQLTLAMQDLGGDPNVVLVGMDIQWVAPDGFGPSILAATPDGESLGPVERIAVTFNEAIDASSFTLSDVSINGPSGTVQPTSLNMLSDSQYEILLPPQTDLGAYSLAIGPDITDQEGNLMDQDADGSGGEAIDDQFSSQFELVAFTPLNFDFGTASSPLESGHTRVTHTTAYDAMTGFGWSSGGVASVDRGSGTALDRDLNYSYAATFSVDLPQGVFDVTITMGDTGVWQHDLMGVFLEGVQVDTVSTAGGQTIQTVYRDVEVVDGQLTVFLDDLGGSDFNIVINALSIDVASGTAAAAGAVSEHSREVVSELTDQVDDDSPRRRSIFDTVSADSPESGSEWRRLPAHLRIAERSLPVLTDLQTAAADACFELLSDYLSQLCEVKLRGMH